MLPFIPDAARTVLDVGCSSGGFGKALKAERDIEVWGVEADQKAAERAAALLDRVVAAPFDDEAPVPDVYFDAVVFNDVLEHMVDPWSALGLACRKLKPSGVVVASIPNLRHIDCLQHLLLERDFRYEGHGIRDRTHLRFFTKRSAERLFEESGFEVIRAVGVNARWWSPSPWRRILYRLFGRLLEDTKYEQFALVARPVSPVGHGGERRAVAAPDGQ